MNKLLSTLFCFLLLSGSSFAQNDGPPHATLLRGPYLQVASPTGITIRWRTDVLTRGVVRYGESPDKLDRIAKDSLMTTEHKIRIQDLQPETKYYYSIGSLKETLQAGPDNYFSTLPPAGKEGTYRIAAVGDCGNNSVNQRNVRDQLVKYLGKDYLNAWILLGDNAYGKGQDAEFQTNFFNIYKDNLLVKYPLFPTPGNHDYYDANESVDRDQAQKDHQIAYYQIFSTPAQGESGGLASGSNAWYSFDLGNIHFLSLDSYGIEQDQYRMYDTLGPQVQWVKKDLEANKNRGWVVAYWHHPPYTMGSHNSDKTDELTLIRENFIRILERYGVDLILCGHSHDYERSKLMQGHFGKMASFSPSANLLSASSAKYDGSPNSCPFVKDSASGYHGTVYVVSGSAGQLGGQQSTYPHTALPYSDATHGGSSLLEVQGNRLDLRWICADGLIRDQFTIMKNVNRNQVIKVKKGESVTLTASYTGDYIWSTGNSTEKTLTLTPEKSTVITVKDKQNCLKDSFTIRVDRN